MRHQTDPIRTDAATQDLDAVGIALAQRCIALIDADLREYGGRELVSGEELVNLLLDLRSAIAIGVEFASEIGAPDAVAAGAAV